MASDRALMALRLALMAPDLALMAPHRDGFEDTRVGPATRESSHAAG